MIPGVMVPGGDGSHKLEAGLRIHRDEEDRLQRNSSYRQLAGRLVLSDAGLPGSAGNRIQQAAATSFYLYDRIELGPWVLSPGIRYEHIKQERTRWETRPDKTDNPASRAGSNIRDKRRNHTKVWLPGFGLLYSFNDRFRLVAGVHKGFTAPGNAPGVSEESAINYEFGFRYAGDNLALDSIYFLSDYDNLLGECTASSGSNCSVGDAFNGDAVKVQGVEIMVTTMLISRAAYSVPLSLNYTGIHSAFESDIAETDFFGTVSRGDPVPYIPQHQLHLSVGLESGRWTTYLNLDYTDAVCVRASCLAFEKTDSALTVDLASHFDLDNDLSIFVKVENLTNARDIVGRHPYGARPGKGRTTTLGLRFGF